MRVSELFNLRTKKKRNIYTLLLFITGILSSLIAVVTVYGQYTGTYLISVTRDAHRKGIAISETIDFKDYRYDIKFDPLHDLDDITESWIDKEEAIKNDGQLKKEGLQYIAFTFYLKNTGDETVNVNYQIKVIDDYKHLGNAAVFKVMEFEQVGEEFILLSETNYSKRDVENTNTIANVDILRFKKNEIRKFTFFVWFEGDYSEPSMLGGAIKFDWVFGITSGIEG